MTEKGIKQAVLCAVFICSPIKQGLSAPFKKFISFLKAMQMKLGKHFAQ